MAQSQVQGQPSGWVQTTLENSVDILDRHRVPVNATEREERIAGKPASELFPYFGATGQVGWIDDYLFDDELVLLGEDGAPFLEPFKAKAYIIRGRTWVNNHAHVLRALAGLTSNSYLCHYLNYADYHDYVTGTTRLKLNQSRMREIPVPIAPLPEQRRIVTEIETQFTRLEAGVAALKRVQANLRRYKASVLKAACEGRLVPTESELARAEGRDYEPADVLLERILAERRAKWEAENPGKKYKEPEPPDTSDLPDLPEGWVWARLDQCSTRITDGTHQPPGFVAEGIPFVFVRHIVGGSLRFDDTKFISESTYDRLQARCPVEVGDILYSAVGSYGVAVPVLTERPFSFQRHIAHIKPSASVVQQYLVTCLNSAICRGQAHQVARGVAQKTVTLGDLSGFSIPMAPLAEQHRIVAEAERRLSVVGEQEKQVEAALRRAERLRQAILKHAFEGKLVPQDPNDEPASALLARILAERSGQAGKQQKKGKAEQLALL